MSFFDSVLDLITFLFIIGSQNRKALKRPLGALAVAELASLNSRKGALGHGWRASGRLTQTLASRDMSDVLDLVISPPRSEREIEGEKDEGGVYFFSRPSNFLRPVTERPVSGDLEESAGPSGAPAGGMSIAIVHRREMTMKNF